MRHLIVALALLPAVAHGNDAPPADCVKRVFDAYCLGSAAETLPKPDEAMSGGVMRYGSIPGPVTLVALHDGRAAMVSRFVRPGAWLTFRGIESDLVAKYGPGEDTSFFPSYADDDASRETSISLGKGRAVRTWKLDGFQIELVWSKRDFVMLRYAHLDLLAAIQAKKRDQY